MNRDEFMKHLEYLLSDIPDEDKADAIAYYRDYLEEAGIEKEEEVIQDFGSPERISSIIRSEIYGSIGDGGEFTEKGYDDGRFKDPNYQMTKRYDLPEGREEYNHKEKREEKKGSSKRRRIYADRRVMLMVCLIALIVATPLNLGMAGSLMGALGAIFGIFIAIVIGLGALTLGLLVSGIVFIVLGIFIMTVHLFGGTLILGGGIFVLGLGLLALVASMGFYGKLLPCLYRSIVNMLQSLLYRRRWQL